MQISIARILHVCLRTFCFPLSQFQGTLIETSHAPVDLDLKFLSDKVIETQSRIWTWCLSGWSRQGWCFCGLRSHNSPCWCRCNIHRRPNWTWSWPHRIPRQARGFARQILLIAKGELTLCRSTALGDCPLVSAWFAQDDWPNFPTNLIQPNSSIHNGRVANTSGRRQMNSMPEAPLFSPPLYANCWILKSSYSNASLASSQPSDPPSHINNAIRNSPLGHPPLPLMFMFLSGPVVGAAAGTTAKVGDNAGTPPDGRLMSTVSSFGSGMVGASVSAANVGAATGADVSPSPRRGSTSNLFFHRHRSPMSTRFTLTTSVQSRAWATLMTAESNKHIVIVGWRHRRAGPAAARGQ